MTKQVAPVVVKHDEGEVLVDGVPRHFPPKQYEILRTLVDAGGKIVTREFLLKKMYGKSGEETDSRSVDQQICRMRRVLGKKVAVYLKTVGGRGYKWTVK